MKNTSQIHSEFKKIEANFLKLSEYCPLRAHDEALYAIEETYGEKISARIEKIEAVKAENAGLKFF